MSEAPERHKCKSIKEANSYLKKVGGVKIPEGRDWNEPCLLSELRNRFVHNLSRKALEPTPEVNVKRNKALFKIGSSGQIILREAFCTHVIELVGRFYLRRPQNLSAVFSRDT